jgi:hypothetical protein
MPAKAGMTKKTPAGPKYMSLQRGQAQEVMNHEVLTVGLFASLTAPRAILHHPFRAEEKTLS